MGITFMLREFTYLGVWSIMLGDLVGWGGGTLSTYDILKIATLMHIVLLVG